MSKENSEIVQELSSKIKKKIDIDHKTGTATVEGDIWESTLPEDLSPAQVKAVKDHETHFVAAGTLAIGSLAVDAMKKNDELDEVAVVVGMAGKDALSVKVDREAEFRNPQSGDTVKKLGSTRVSYRVTAGKSSGELAKAIATVGTLAEEALGS